MTTDYPSSMRAVVFDGRLRIAKDYPVPELPSGWALIRVNKAGICGTDLELIKGYRGFAGIPGHEFVGTVQHSHDTEWIGKRVTAEINIACGRCVYCLENTPRHCLNRKVLGIDRFNGCMADFCILPTANLLEIPPPVVDDRAVFIEPLSAACEILEQLQIQNRQRILVLGDGRLGILCAWALSTVCSDVTLIGRHPQKLETARWRQVKTVVAGSGIAPNADIVVDATGSDRGIVAAMSLCRPRGTIVLKSTLASWGEVDLSAIVINELTVVGSRCGKFEDGLRMLEAYPDMPLGSLITACYPIEKAPLAFEHANRPEALKILIEM